MTQTERELQELKKTLATYVERLDTARAEIESLWKENDKLATLLKEERVKAEAAAEKLRDLLSDVKTKCAVLESGFDEHKERVEEAERRRWTMYGIGIAAVLTFAANLVLLILRK